MKKIGALDTNNIIFGVKTQMRHFSHFQVDVPKYLSGVSEKLKKAVPGQQKCSRLVLKLPWP